MRPFVCRSCRVARTYVTATTQFSTSQAPARKSSKEAHIKIDIEKLASRKNPSWSVKSLLPAADDEASKSKDKVTIPAAKSEAITTKQLEHLLRLSALPIPESEKERAKMLRDLESQLHFVRAIREVNTEGVEPLVQIRDESEEGVKEATIGMDQLRDVLTMEERKGRNMRPRRRRSAEEGTDLADLAIREGGLERKEVASWTSRGLEDKTKTPKEGESVWDVLGTAEEKSGRYFVVRSWKENVGGEKGREGATATIDSTNQ